MSEQFRVCLSQLHMACKTYQLQKVHRHLLRLLQQAKMSEKPLGETIDLAKYAQAKAFWCKLLSSRKDDLVTQRARDIYCTIWAVEHGILSPAIRGQSGTYCDSIAECCEAILQEMAATALPAPTRVAHPFSVITGDKAAAGS